MVKELKSYADAGSVLVGTKDFGVLIDNGYGDGESNIIIGTQQELSMFDKKFLTIIKGNFNIYNYDCCKREEDEILITLSGRYGVYNNNGTVYFEEWRI